MGVLVLTFLSSGVSMADSSAVSGTLDQMSPEQLRAALVSLLPERSTREQRVTAIREALGSPMGRAVRGQMGAWIVDRLVPVDHVVPEPYAPWRPPVRDAMLFVVNHLSEARLAPKLLEQLELPPNASPEKRLLQLIAKVPGLQKLGQVIARNKHLRPELRKALAELENGIHDVDVETVREIIHRELGAKLEKYQVKIQPRILSEASVSAVVRFTWKNPETGYREHGVFKVLKPHIPEYFAEDMDFLHALARYFGTRHREYGRAAKLIPDTFKKVRRLLRHEVNFVREQQTLVEAGEMYRRVRGVHVPTVMEPLCTPIITALSEEHGSKVTDMARRLPEKKRARVADQLVEALLAIPLFAAGEHSLFHADPHAGNLLYNGLTGELILIDWALPERLTREQRRHLALLFAMVALRDRVGASNAILALAERELAHSTAKARAVRQRVAKSLDHIPLFHVPSAVDAMRLLEEVAYQGIRFPSSLIMLCKVVFTLDGILHDIGGSTLSIGKVMARHIARSMVINRKAFASPLRRSDWARLQCSAFLLGSRALVKAEQAILDRVLPEKRVAI